LPPNVNQLHDEFLKGPFLLQIDELTNIGEALETRFGESARRCLKLRLTDGYQSLFGFEYRRIPEFTVDMRRGTKVLLREVMMRRGMAMLQPERVVLLGGHIVETEEEEEAAAASSPENIANQNQTNPQTIQID